MPGWIWVILAIAFIAVLIIGGIYVFVHARDAVRSLKPLGSRASESLAHMHDSVEDQPEKNPSIARPLAEVADDYSRAHANLLQHKEPAKLRRIDSWRKWNQFNE